MSGQEGAAAPRRASRWWYLLLVIPFIATLFPQIYNAQAPSLGSVPFFYWYQLLWVIVTGAITAIVYAITR